MLETQDATESTNTLIHSITRDDAVALEYAACAGVNPRLFDETTYPQAWNALKVCSSCPRRTQWACLKKIEPHRTWFDGVAGGMVWRNGIVQTVTGKTIHLTDRTLIEYFDERNPQEMELE